MTVKIREESVGKIEVYKQKKLNATKVWMLFLFCGWSYGSMGKIQLQILFYLTLGGLGVWALFRLFTLNQAIDKYNLKLRGQIGIPRREIPMKRYNIEECL